MAQSNALRLVLERFPEAFSFSLQLKRKNPAAVDLHLKSSNLFHLQGELASLTSTRYSRHRFLFRRHCLTYSAIVERLEELPDVTAVLKRFHSPGGASVEVDVICNEGYTWVKVVARKAEALHRVWAGLFYVSTVYKYHTTNFHFFTLLNPSTPAS